MKLRRPLALIHHYSGLALLAFVLLAAATGSVLVFSHELDRWLNPELLRVAVPAAGRAEPYAAQLAAAEAHLAGQGEGPWLPVSLIPGRHADSATGVLFRRPDLARPGKSLWWQVLVDPWTARVLGQRELTRLSADRAGLMNFLSAIHGNLLLGDLGRKAMGVAAILWTLTTPLGLFLWWPGRRKLRRALTVERRAGPARLHFDLHRVAGLYSAPVLFVVALSGIYMAWPVEVRALANAVSPVDGGDAPKMPVRGEMHAPRLDADAAVHRARSVFPDGELRRIGLPRHAGDAYAVSIRQPGEVRRPSTARSTAWIDADDGVLLKVYDAPRAAAGDTYLDWQTPLHTGSAFGLAGRIAVSVAGMAACLLCVSGFLVWRRRTRRPVPTPLLFPNLQPEPERLDQ